MAGPGVRARPRRRGVRYPVLKPHPLTAARTRRLRPRAGERAPVTEPEAAPERSHRPTPQRAGRGGFRVGHRAGQRAVDSRSAGWLGVTTLSPPRPMTRHGGRTPRGGGYATARVATGRESGRPSERVAPRFAGPDAAAPGPAPHGTDARRYAIRPRAGERPAAAERDQAAATPPSRSRPLAGPGEVHGARTAGQDGAPTCCGPVAPPGRAAFAARLLGGDTAAGGVAAPAIPALGRAPATGVGCRTGRRGGYATAGRAARAVPAARRERWAGFPPGRASGPAPLVQVAYQRVVSRTRRNGGAVVSLRSLRRSDAALARLRKLRRARWRPLSWLPAFAARPAVPRAGEPVLTVQAVRGGALRAPPRCAQWVRRGGAGWP